MSDPRYPIGKFKFDGPPDEEQRQKFIADIEQAPAALRAAIQGLSPQQIETPYRDGGWTVRQVVHHVPESHMNAYIRFKLALTEDAPTIKPYREDRWAETPDVLATPLEVSLALLDSLHIR
jgi:DinB family protein